MMFSSCQKKDAVKSTRPVQKHQQAPATPYMGTPVIAHTPTRLVPFSEPQLTTNTTNTPHTRRRAHGRRKSKPKKRNEYTQS